MQMMKVVKRNNCHLILTINHRSGVYDLRAGNARKMVFSTTGKYLQLESINCIDLGDWLCYACWFERRCLRIFVLVLT